MTCTLNPVDYEHTTSIVSTQAPTIDPASAPSGTVLLPHTGAAKVYSQTVPVIGTNDITLHFYIDGLHFTSQQNETVLETHNQLTEQCSDPYPATVPGSAVLANQTYNQVAQGLVSIQYCFLAPTCTNPTPQVFAAGQASWGPNYNPNAFTRSVTINWADFLTFGCLRELPFEISDLSDNVTLRVYRTDNFTSSGAIYFAGYDVTPGNAWVQTLPTIEADESIPVPTPTGASPTPSIGISDDGVAPQFGASGGSFGSILCDGSTGGPGGDTPTLTIADATVAEDVGTVNVPVTLSPTASGTVTVQYTTVDGSAIAPGDYIAASGLLTFTAGESSKNISITIVNNSDVEFTESFTIELSSPTGGAVIGDGTGIVTITDDDSETPTGDCLVQVSDNDAECNYLQAKLVAGTGMSFTILNEGSAEQIQIDSEFGFEPGPTCPTITATSPYTKVYTAGSGVDFPSMTATADSDPVEVVVELQTGLGTISTATVVAGVTSVWDASAKTFTISGPVADVNQVLGDLTYNSSASDGGTIEYIVRITDDDGNVGRSCVTLRFTVSSIITPYTNACTGNLTLTGTSGSIKVEVKYPTGELVATIAPSVAFNTDIETTIDDIVQEINDTVTVPKFTATKIDADEFKVCAAPGLGDIANGWQVVTTTISGDLAASGTKTLDGGITGNKPTNPKGLGADSFGLEDLFEIAGEILDTIDDNEVAQGLVDVPVDEEEPVRNIRVKFQGRKVYLPDVYNPTTRTYSGAWDLTTFSGTKQYTNNVAYCLLDFIRDPKRLGPKYYDRMTAAQKLVLHQDIYDAAVRCDESPHSDIRYTLNGVTSTGRSNEDIMQDIAGVMHARVLKDPTNILRVVQDRPRSPALLMNQTGIEERGISYATKSPKTIINRALVSYYDPSQYSKLKTVQVDATVDGVIPATQSQNFVGWGIDNNNQAIRHGRWIVENENRSVISGKYLGGIDHRLIIPNQNIRLLDEFNEFDTEAAGGRILAVQSSTVVDVDRDLTITGTPTFYVVMEDGTIHETTVDSYSNGGGSGPFRVTMADAAATTVRAGAKYNVTDGQIYTLVKRHNRDKGIYEAFMLNYDPSIYTAIDAAI